MAVDYMPVGAPHMSDAQMRLEQLRGAVNIAALLKDDGPGGLAEIAGRVIEEYGIDKKSRERWESSIKAGMDLAMLVAEDKNYPFENAANVKYPLLTTAALQFNARAYPAIVQGNRVIKCATWGDDPQGQKAARADRVSEHMSFQILAEQPEWEEDTDKLLVILPIVGCAFRKVYFDPALGRTVTRLVTADRLVVNYHARSMDDCPRVTEEMHLYPYEIQERIRSGRFVEFDYLNASNTETMEGEQEQSSEQDRDAPHLFLEQHRLLDLDGDGYPEPYVVTVHHATSKVCRIAANWSDDSVSIREDGRIAAIRKQQYYVKYQFLPSPDAGFYGWGFGWLLKDITESINTTLNQMLDAGHLANVQGGLLSGGANIREKSIRIEAGEWRVINTNIPLKDAMFPINYPGPSATLFNLLGLLIDAGRDVTAIKDVLTGEGQGKNASPTTTLALIEQGLQVFTSIYKRIYRALKAELGIHARINRENLDPVKYNNFFDGEQSFDPKIDYNEKDMDILPVSDPAVVSKMQKLAKAEFIYQTSQTNPMINPVEALRRMFEAADIEEPEKLIMEPPPPDPETDWLMKMSAALELDEKAANILKAKAGALKDVAAADSEEQTGSLNRARLMFEMMSKELDAAMQMESGVGQGRVSSMEGQPGDAMGGQAPLANGGGAQDGAPGATISLDGGDGPGLGQPASAGGL